MFIILNIEISISYNLVCYRFFQASYLLYYIFCTMSNISLLYLRYLIRAFRLRRKDLLLFCFFIIRAFRLRRKDLLLLCFLIIFFFLDTFTFQFWGKQCKPLTNFYNVSVANRSAMCKRLCQLPVFSLPVSSNSKRFWVWKPISFHRFEKIPWNFGIKFIFS